MSFTPYDCSNRVQRIHDPCNEQRERGRISNFAFIKKDISSTLTWDDPVLLRDELLAAELACNAYILRRTSGSYGGEDVVSDGRGRSKEEVTNTDHTLEIVDHEPVPNVSFWNNIKKQIQFYDCVFFTETKIWRVTGKSLVVKGNPVIEDDLDTFITAAITVTWTHKDAPTAYDFDFGGGFGEYPTLGNGSLSGNGSEIITDTTITVSTNSLVDVDIIFTTPATTYELQEGSVLPTWLTLDSGIGKITGTSPATTESSEFTILGTNNCGVCSDVVITVIVQ